MALRPSSHVHTLPSGVRAGVHTGVDAEIAVGINVGVDASVHRCAQTDAMGCAVRRVNSFPNEHVVHEYAQHVHRRDPHHPYPCMDITRQCSHLSTCVCPAPTCTHHARGQCLCRSCTRPPQGRAAAASCVSAGDFLLLLCASQQWQVFLAERTEEWQHVAGVNTDHLEPLRGEPNPVPNFVHCRWVPGCRQPAQPSQGLHRRRGCRAGGHTWLGRSPGQVLPVVSLGQEEGGH